MSTIAKIDMNSSQCYRLVEGSLRSFVNVIETDRRHSRRIALSSVQKAAGLPMTSEGMSLTRQMTEDVLQQMVSRKEIEGYLIRPRKENGAESVFVQLPKAGAGADD